MVNSKIIFLNITKHKLAEIFFFNVMGHDQKQYSPLLFQEQSLFTNIMKAVYAIYSPTLTTTTYSL